MPRRLNAPSPKDRTPLHLVDVLNHALVQVGAEDDVTRPHLFDQLVGLGRIPLLIPVLDHEGKHITDANASVLILRACRGQGVC